MGFTARVLLVAPLFATCVAIAQDTVAPPPALALENVPAIGNNCKRTIGICLGAVPFSFYYY